MASFIILIFVAVIYFIPILVANSRGHHNQGSIFIINLLLGWTFIGWVVALAMACSAVNPRTEASIPPAV